jgi:hypothetical protein
MIRSFIKGVAENELAALENTKSLFDNGHCRQFDNLFLQPV